LSGDDDKTYYGKTSLEHQENIDKYCKKKCQILWLSLTLWGIFV